ncbi:RNA-directed DNA polymerase from transposon X-element [Paramuricea clavata]|uniref:RNA-directed DNA polymerase from transposon X-element n=1 Tax=Paramuricea clavata TaxID=317549 RepID=A0A7D9LJW7_PARCT|nr:RNA-directed DNA polymerase from transposon X-element [Paramuricea clavata]
MCKLRKAKFLEQQMRQLAEARLKPAPAFNHVMTDLFGPYSIRGEVQKRTSGKAYGIIFTDLVMRAVHIEAVFGYDTESFLMALSRFVSVRGWPEIIYSDPGSQLIGAERELTETWKSIDRQSLRHRDPADSPWYQGVVESLVKSAKRAFYFAINNQRLSVQEFMTVCSEATNHLNERPIGTLRSADSELNILTPNSLLLGRATAKNPGGWQPNSNNPGTRYHAVQNVKDEFWKKWTELYAPALVIRRK